SKVDLIDNEKLNKVREKIREVNEKVTIVESINGEIDYNFLEKDLIGKGWLGVEDTTNTPENRPKTLTLTYDGNITKDQLTQFIDTIKKDCYRMKGFFKLEDGWNQVDVVGKRIDYKLTNKNEEKSQLIIISKVGPQIIRPIFSNWEEIVGDKMKLR